MCRAASEAPGGHAALSPARSGRESGCGLLLGRSGSEGPRLIFRVNLFFTGKTLGEKNNVIHANAFGVSNMFLLIMIEMQRCQLAFLRSRVYLFER